MLVVHPAIFVDLVDQAAGSHTGERQTILVGAYYVV